MAELSSKVDAPIKVNSDKIDSANTHHLIALQEKPETARHPVDALSTELKGTHTSNH